MKMIQLSETKKEKLSSLTEGIMAMAKKLMTCVEDLEGGDAYGERSRYGYRMPDDDMPEERYGDRWEAYGDRRSMRRY